MLYMGTWRDISGAYNLCVIACWKPVGGQKFSSNYPLGSKWSHCWMTSLYLKLPPSSPLGPHLLLLFLSQSSHSRAQAQSLALSWQWKGRGLPRSAKAPAVGWMTATPSHMAPSSWDQGQGVSLSCLAFRWPAMWK